MAIPLIPELILLTVVGEDKKFARFNNIGGGPGPVRIDGAGEAGLDLVGVPVRYKEVCCGVVAAVEIADGIILLSKFFIFDFFNIDFTLGICPKYISPVDEDTCSNRDRSSVKWSRHSIRF